MMKIENVTIATVCDATGLDKTLASGFLRLLASQGFATETGHRKQVSATADGYAVMRGRPSVLFSLDFDAVAAALNTEKAQRIADKAATAHAEYVRMLAHAEAAGKAKRDAAAKAAKVDRLTKALAAIKAEPTGEVF